jgi:hypothetical protein
MERTTRNKFNISHWNETCMWTPGNSRVQEQDLAFLVYIEAGTQDTGRRQTK